MLALRRPARLLARVRLCPGDARGGRGCAVHVRRRAGKLVGGVQHLCPRYSRHLPRFARDAASSWVECSTTAVRLWLTRWTTMREPPAPNLFVHPPAVSATSCSLPRLALKLPRRLAAGTLEAMPTHPRAHGQSRGTMHFLRTAPVPLPWTGKRGGLVSPMWDQCGIAPSTALNCASPLTGSRQVGQHRSHIVAPVSSACLIARAAVSGSQGRIVSSLSPGRPCADVGLSAAWSDLSAVSTTDQVGVF